jgi:hypothetical protein
MLISLWSASLFRDNQTAVVAGNGFPLGKFRQGRRENFCVAGLKFASAARLNGAEKRNFRGEKNKFMQKSSSRTAVMKLFPGRFRAGGNP